MPLFVFYSMNAAKLVADSLLGYDTKYIIVNGRPYAVKPPTIRVIAGAARFLVELEKEDSAELDIERIECSAQALSWFVKGDLSLAEVFKDAPLKEVTDGIETAVRLIDTRDFMRLSTLSRSLQKLIAKAKPR